MKNEFMQRAIELSIESINSGGGPFGIFNMMHLGVLRLDAGITNRRATVMRGQKCAAPIV